ncbi:glutaconate CoA-transferase subunit A [Paenibacillus sp. UNCCL117]|uniref:CoA transferase subunit A n=1 Tax=unclassified Paenibacillus TaxID=185978 RepID=UPI000883EF5E|nr:MULTISPECIES: CoA-transferase [unclassified Paenibacillus]SDE28597.1 glutaconate CoA-transferase subunit A [Paenibacillus sp. cl123]SFW63446.1 glutaconate CoA-transferase subunit A [Paenibacillus sp. UNCCL117]
MSGEAAPVSKVLSLPEAVGRIRDGDRVAISGNMEMSPMALIRELIRSDRRGLSLICAGAAAVNADLLIGSGLADSVEFSQIALGEFGFAPNFRRAFEQGKARAREHACPSLAAALQAGAMGIPFIPVRGLLGTDYMAVRDDFRVLANPYDVREEIAIVPALRPDVALLHGYKADRLGNVVASPSQNNRLLAQASAFTIVSVEELVPPEELRAVPGSFIPSVYVGAVVVAPGGAWPTACPGSYGIDEEHMRLYMEAARSEAAFDAYLSRYVREAAEGNKLQDGSAPESAGLSNESQASWQGLKEAGR